MNIPYLKFFMLLLCLVVGMNVCATVVPTALPFSFNDGIEKVNKLSCMEQSGLIDDYTDSPYLKFESTGAYLVINFTGTSNIPMYLTYTLDGKPQPNGKNTSGTFDVLESDNGIDYTTVKSYKNLSSSRKTETYVLSSTSNYVKFVYTNKNDGNVALGNITISNILTRSTKSGKYGTICLPTAAKAVGATIYSAALNAANDMVELSEVTDMVAGTPYIYKATANVQTFTCNGAAVTTPVTTSPLVGVFTDTNVATGTYVLQTQNDVQQFYIVTAEDPITVPHYKAYIAIPYEAKALGIGFNEETSISAVNSLISGDAKIYGLDGHRLNSLHKGINIVNGVKILVK